MCSPPPDPPWAIADVIGHVELPAFVARTYREQADLRRLLAVAHARAPISAAADVGCGFGRLLPVLAEVAATVTGFEREPALAAEAGRLWPEHTVVRVETLMALPAPAAAFDILLTFVVLQHLADPVARAAIAELVRLRRPRGHVLVCEDTDSGFQAKDPTGRITIGRTVETYAAWFAPLRLVAQAPRRIEPTYPRAAVGTFLLFGS